MIPLRRFLLAAAAVLAASAAAEAAPSKRKKAALPVRKAAAAQAPAAAPETSAPSRPASDPEMKALLAQIDASGGDKKRLKSYMKLRSARLKDQHKGRVDFLDKEADSAKAFWSKLYEDRLTFEERMVKQTQDMFESLSSLDKADRSTALTDVERTQSSLSRIFETQQRQKTADFFAAREKRWAEFAAKQERERLDFLAQAPADWQRTGGKEQEKAPAAGEAGQPQ
jgi:hypothetical protein